MGRRHANRGNEENEATAVRRGIDARALRPRLGSQVSPMGGGRSRGEPGYVHNQQNERQGRGGQVARDSRSFGGSMSRLRRWLWVPARMSMLLRTDP